MWVWVVCGIEIKFKSNVAEANAGGMQKEANVYEEIERNKLCSLTRMLMIPMMMMLR